MVIKGIIKYLLILVGVVIAIGIVTVGAMYFFPSINLFGYEFYHGSIWVSSRIAIDQDRDGDSNYILKVDGDIAGDFDVLILKSDGFDISVSTFEGATALAEYFHYDFTTDMNGFKKVGDNAPHVVVTTDERELITGEGPKKILQIEVQEPSGLFLRQNTRLKLQLRHDLVDFQRLIVDSNSGIVSFSSGLEGVAFNIDRADINCSSGKVTLSNMILNDQLNIEKRSGDFKMNNDISASVNLNCNEGNFYFKKITGADSEVKVVGENGHIVFGDIEGSADVRMHYGLFEAGTISGEFNAQSNPDTGAKNSCDYKIDKVLKTVLINNDSGNISIGQTSKVDETSSFSQIEIDSNSGNIAIANCFSKYVEIKNGRGKITLGNCLGSLDLSTTYGSINVDFLTSQDTIEDVEVDDFNEALNNLASKTIKIETGRNNSGDGSIKVENIASKATIKSNGAGSITAKFLAIVGDNKVESNRGRVDVVTPTYTSYLLKWLAKNSADVQVYTIFTDRVDSFQYEPEDASMKADNGWLKIEGATAESTDKLDVASKNASLKISDR